MEIICFEYMTEPSAHRFVLAFRRRLIIFWRIDIALINGRRGRLERLLRSFWKLPNDVIELFDRTCFFRARLMDRWLVWKSGVVFFSLVGNWNVFSHELTRFGILEENLFGCWNYGGNCTSVLEVCGGSS